MLKKILVCLDGSKFAERVLPFTIERAQQFGSKIVLLKVIDLSSAVSIFAMPGIAGQSVPITLAGRMEYTVHEQEARDNSYLQRVAERLKGLRLDVDFVALHAIAGASIADTIVSYAAKNAFNLIIMAAHNRTFWSRLVLGSMTESVVRKSDIPVLVVKPKIRTPAEGLQMAYTT